MERTRHTIKRKTFPSVQLISLTGHTWYDNNDNIISWSGLTSGPTTGYTIYNVTGGIVQNGFYVWGTPTENIWNSITESDVYGDHQLPIYLEAKADEMGQMVDFNGDIGQNVISANFTYERNCNTIKIYNTTNYGKLKNNAFSNDVTYSIGWGDGTYSGISTNGYVEKTYTVDDTYKINITLDSPWTREVITKFVLCEACVPIETYYLLQETDSEINLEDSSGSIEIEH